MRRVYRRYSFAVLLLVVAALGYWGSGASVGWTSAKKNNQRDMPQRITAKCTHVVDGDSLYLQGFKPQVRLWGVDAPERNEAGYASAKAALTGMAQGRALRCERQATDKYGRLVARCFVVAADKMAGQPAEGAGALAGSYEINRQLIERGVASEYCWFSKGFYGHCNNQ